MEAGTVDCECGKQINERFASCPFCGAQLRAKSVVRPSSLDEGHGPNPDGVMADAGLSKEARVAMASNVFSGRRPSEEVVTGAGSGLTVALLPSRYSGGWMRYAEITLTVISFPFFVVSMFGIIFQGVKGWGRIDVFTWVTGAAFGAPLLGLVLYIGFGFSFKALMWIVGIGLAAWFARGVLRWFAAAKRLSDYS